MAIYKFSGTLPTQREDGTPLPVSEIQSVEIWQGTAAIPKNSKVGSYAPAAFDPGPIAVDVSITAGDLFVAVVIDTSGQESAVSAQVELPALPGAPTLNVSV